MSDNLVDITIHIDENTDHDEREALRDALLAMNGVMTAVSRDEKPHLMIIEYDPDRINPSAFLNTISNRGLHSELIGL